MMPFQGPRVAGIKHSMPFGVHTRSIFGQTCQQDIFTSCIGGYSTIFTVENITRISQLDASDILVRKDYHRCSNHTAVGTGPCVTTAPFILSTTHTDQEYMTAAIYISFCDHVSF